MERYFDLTCSTDQTIHYLMEESKIRLDLCTAANICRLDNQMNFHNCSMSSQLEAGLFETACQMSVVLDFYLAILVFCFACIIYHGYSLVFLPIRVGMAMIGWYTHRIVFAPVIPGSQSH